MDTPQWKHAARHSDLDTFNTVIQAHQDQVYSLAVRVLGDESAAAQVVESAFLHAFRDFKSFRGGSLRLWLYRYVVQEVRSALRRSRFTGAPAQRGSPEASMNASLGSLPPDLRLVAILVDVEGLDYTETGTVLGLSARTVSSHLAQARSSLSAI